MAVRIQMRRGTTSQWNTADPVLNSGEIGYNETLKAFKLGDGSTVWSELDYYQTTAEITPSDVGAISLTEKGAAGGVAELDSNKDVITASKLIFEGATVDAYEAYLQLGGEPIADITLTLPTTSGVILTADTSGNVVITGDLTVNGTTTTIDTQNLQVEDKNITLGYGATSDAAVDGGGITLTGATNKTFNWVDATDAWTSSEHINLVSGKNYLKNGTDIKDVTETLTNKTISGSSNTITNIGNSSLTNSSITINGSSVSLGGSVSITGLPSQTGNNGKYLTTDGTTASWATIAADIEGVTAGTGLTGGGTSGTVTLSVDTTVVATTNNTLTLTNKTLTSPVISTISNTGTLTLPTSTDTLVGRATADTLTNKTISGANNTLTVRLANDISGFGTGVATALGINTGSSGAPVLFNGALGTPSSGTLTNATGLPVTSGISGMGTGVATFLATPSSANLASAITDETGSGALVFATSPTISLPSIDNPRYGYTTTATAAGTTTLTVSSNFQQFFTGSTTQTVVLPVASTMTLGQGFYIENNATGNLTVNSSGGNLVATVTPGTTVLITNILTSGTTAASWDVDWHGFGTITGTGSNVLATAPTITNLVLSGTLNAGGGNGTSGQVLQSTGTGVQWSTAAAGAAFSEMLLVGC